MTETMQLFDVKTIDEVTEKIIDYRGKTPPKTHEGIKLITAKVIKDGYILSDKHEYISKETYQEWMTRGFPKKWDVLITTEAPLGEVALLRTEERIALAQRVILLRGKSGIIDQKYYMYALKTSLVQDQLKASSVSTTVAGIKQSDLREIKIPYFPIEEQKRIATIAQKADRLRRTRRYTLELSDSYLQSVFLKIFCQTDSQKWDLLTVESLAKSIRTGPFGSQLLHSEFTEDGDVSVLGIDNAVQNHFTWEKRRFITKQKYEQLKRYRVYPGDVLITIMGTCGRCAIVPENIPLTINTKHLCCITLDQKKCLPTYLQSFFLRHPLALKQLGISERGAVMPGLNMSLIKDLVMPIPPLPLQEKFAQVVQRFERLRTQQCEADRQAEHLFQTILHRAFRGEL